MKSPLEVTMETISTPEQDSRSTGASAITYTVREEFVKSTKIQHLIVCICGGKKLVIIKLVSELNRANETRLMIIHENHNSADWFHASIVWDVPPDARLEHEWMWTRAQSNDEFDLRTFVSCQVWDVKLETLSSESGVEWVMKPIETQSPVKLTTEPTLDLSYSCCETAADTQRSEMNGK